MSLIYDLLVSFANWVWGLPVLIWLLGGGLILTIATNSLQFRKFFWVLKNTIFSKKSQNKENKEDISSYSAVMAALSSTVGTGNIVGVAIGIVNGGPGAVFWMWVVGFVAMAIKYSEVVASLKFRTKRSDGEYNAGPFMYLQGAFAFKTIGKVFAVCYAIAMMICLLVAAGVHNGALVDNLAQANINRWVSTIVVMILITIVAFGGVKILVKITDKLVPIMSLLFILGACVIIVLNIQNVIPSLVLIVKSAFNPVAATGGFLGASVAAAIRWGCARGMYSNDAGNGITSIIHGQANVKHPVEQGIWGIFEVFFSTMVICTFTALSIIVSGAWLSKVQNPAILTIVAFENMLGIVGKMIIIIAVTLFAFSTLLSFVYFIGTQAKVLTKSTVVARILQLMFIGMLMVGGIYGVEKIMVIADAANAIAIFINMTGLLLLTKVIRNETKDYFNKVDK